MPKRPSQASEIVSRDNIVLYTTLCQLSFLTFRYSFPIPKRPAVSSTLFPHFQSRREIFYVARCLGTCRISLSLFSPFLFIREINYIRDTTRCKFGYARIRRLPLSLHSLFVAQNPLSRESLAALNCHERSLSLLEDKRFEDRSVYTSIKIYNGRREGRLAILIVKKKKESN